MKRADTPAGIAGREERLWIMIGGPRGLIVIVVSGAEIDHVGVKVEHLQSWPIEAESRDTETRRARVQIELIRVIRRNRQHVVQQANRAQVGRERHSRVAVVHERPNDLNCQCSVDSE